MNPNTIKYWLLRGELEKLENVVLEGKGSRLLGENSPDLRTRVFLKGLPNYLTKITQIHDAVVRGSLPEVQRLINDEPKKKLALAKDSSGTPLLHKAVCYDQPHIVQWLVENYPATAQQKDKEGRTALHYCSACKDPEAVWDILVDNNCDITVCDKKGNPASYYFENSSEIELPELMKSSNKKAASGKKEYLDFKPSNIRIWIHNRDIGKLQRVLWEGHGAKLRRETSNNSRVKKFLEAVPFIMGTIKNVHAAVVSNDLDGFRKLISEPVSPIILCSKDSNGLNVLHKSVGLGYAEMTREILNNYPAALYQEDNEGRTPLHYAAALKDGGVLYSLLVEYGADESKIDHKMRVPAFYKSRPSEIDTSVLGVIPDAPRVSSTKYPKNWDWRILEGDNSVVRSVKKLSSNSDSAIGSDDSHSQPSTKTSPVKNENATIKNKIAEEVKNVDDEFGENVNSETTIEKPNNENHVDEEKKEVELVEIVESVGEKVLPDEHNNNITNEMKEITEENNDTDILKIEESVENGVDCEKNSDHGTCDSGVADTVNEEEQAIVGQHEELPEAELNDAGTEEDREVDDLVNNGNMEQLATLVLNGEGRRLLGRHSNNAELQAFIENVPAYMGKIHAVHLAAREGNLRDLQSALDRRKFAVARDSISPRGATPLHVAVIFGNTAVIRYLAGRFPETAHATDLDGRTPLHYASTLADNGHYYNLLLHLGANPLLQDNFGHKAEYYKQNQNELSHKKLLRDFGARENLADEMLTDKVPGGDIYSARRDVTEPETLATLERCFRLLAGTRRGSAPNTPGNTSGTLLGRCLKRQVFEKIKTRVTCMDHNLFHVIWPAMKRYSNSNNLDSRDGSRPASSLEEDYTGSVVAPDYESYIVFAELFDPLIRELHCVTASGELPDQPEPQFFLNDPNKNSTENMHEAEKMMRNYDLDAHGKYVNTATIECTRNLERFPLALTMTVNQLEDAERLLTTALMSQDVSAIIAEESSEDEAGTYYTLNEVLERPSEVRTRLAKSGLLMPISEIELLNEKRLHGRHWPYGRGVYVAAAGNLAAWINVQDHLRVVCCTREDAPGYIGKVYFRIARIINILDARLRFKRHRKLGFLGARPAAIGNTLRFDVECKFANLAKEPDHLRHLCVVRGLRFQETMKRDVVRIGNQQSLSITELQTLHDFTRALVNILTLEKEMALNSSLKIATLIANIFKKRKMSTGSRKVSIN